MYVYNKIKENPRKGKSTKRLIDEKEKRRKNFGIYLNYIINIYMYVYYTYTSNIQYSEIEGII